MTPNVRLHIDQIVLHGFEHMDRTRLHAALETEFVRLFGEQGTPGSLAQPRHTPRLDTGRLRAAPDTTPEHLGAQLAQTIYTGLQR